MEKHSSKQNFTKLLLAISIFYTIVIQSCGEITLPPELEKSLDKNDSNLDSNKEVEDSLKTLSLENIDGCWVDVTDVSSIEKVKFGSYPIYYKKTDNGYYDLTPVGMSYLGSFPSDVPSTNKLPRIKFEKKDNGKYSAEYDYQGSSNPFGSSEIPELEVKLEGRTLITHAANDPSKVLSKVRSCTSPKNLKIEGCWMMRSKDNTHNTGVFIFKNKYGDLVLQNLASFLGTFNSYRNSSPSPDVVAIANQIESKTFDFDKLNDNEKAYFGDIPLYFDDDNQTINLTRGEGRVESKVKIISSDLMESLPEFVKYNNSLEKIERVECSELNKEINSAFESPSEPAQNPPSPNPTATANPNFNHQPPTEAKPEPIIPAQPIDLPKPEPTKPTAL
jgi:hypothetical protein